MDSFICNLKGALILSSSPTLSSTISENPDLTAKIVALELRVTKLEKENQELQQKIGTKATFSEVVRSSTVITVTEDNNSRTVKQPPIKLRKDNDPPANLYAATRTNWDAMEREEATPPLPPTLSPSVK